MCFDDDDWLEGSPQPTSEAVLKKRREREREAEMRKQLAATKAKGGEALSEADADLKAPKKSVDNLETPNPAAEKGTDEKKKD